MLKVLDLFSGIGGFSLGLECTGGFETVAFCEIEAYPQKVLKKHWPDVPLYEDVRELTGERLREDGITVDVICGGYPCQPFSSAGKRRGAEDDRHLWPEVNRLIREIRPTWAIFENVAGHISMGLDSVLSDLEGQGYTWETFVIPACALDARHRRDRVWIVANSASGQQSSGLDGSEFEGSKEAASERTGRASGKGCDNAANTNSDTLRKQPGRGSGPGGEGAPQPELSCEKWTFTNSCSIRLQGRSISGEGKPEKQSPTREEASGGSSSKRASRHFGKFKSAIRGSFDGLSDRLDKVDMVASGVPDKANRLKALGNAVVPQIPELIGRAILALECDTCKGTGRVCCGGKPGYYECCQSTVDCSECGA